jgi:hypothetical protein
MACGLESPTGHGRFNEGGFDAPRAVEEKKKLENSRVRRGDSPLLKLGSISTTSPPRSNLGWAYPIARLPDCSLPGCQQNEDGGNPAENGLGDLLADWGSPAESSVACHWPTTVAHPPKLQMSLLLLEQAWGGGDRSCHSVWRGMPRPCGSRWGRSSVPPARCHRGNPGSGREKHVCRQVGGTFSVGRGEDGQRLKRWRHTWGNHRFLYVAAHGHARQAASALHIRPSFGSRPSDRRRAGEAHRLGWWAPGGQGETKCGFAPALGGPSGTVLGPVNTIAPPLNNRKNRGFLRERLPRLQVFF